MVEDIVNFVETKAEKMLGRVGPVAQSQLASILRKYGLLS